MFASMVGVSHSVLHQTRLTESIDLPERTVGCRLSLRIGES